MPMLEFNVTLPSESLVEDIDQQFVQKREEDVLSKQEFELILMMHVVLMMTLMMIRKQAFYALNSEIKFVAIP